MVLRLRGVAMNANDWEKLGQSEAEAAAVDLSLPSGMVIKARRPDPVMLASWGVLPFSLAAAVSGEGGDAPASTKIVEIAKFMRTVLEYCCVSPRISLEPKCSLEIHPARIPDKDAMYIVSWATRRPESASLASFRADGRDGGGSGDGPEVRPTA
ncbi:MAG: hypothetical protein KGL39_11515 [Patescibacteria group bacterium]|nr:hypothetical protein [Patescibacteria group bacterium]